MYPSVSMRRRDVARFFESWRCAWKRRYKHRGWRETESKHVVCGFCRPECGPSGLRWTAHARERLCERGVRHGSLVLCVRGNVVITVLDADMCPGSPPNSDWECNRRAVLLRRAQHEDRRRERAAKCNGEDTTLCKVLPAVRAFLRMG
jgi:hypothetical protein